MLDAGRAWRAMAFDEAGPLLTIQATLARRAWRIGPALAVLAGALASGASLLTGDAPLRLVGAVILADPAWGLLWRLATSGEDHAGASKRTPPGLPFAHPDAPLARALHRMEQMSSAAAWHELPMALALTAGLSVLLGPHALALTVAGLVVLFIAWLAIARGGQPALAYALLSVGLPWTLGALLAGGAGGFGLQLVLAGAFTLLMWGGQQVGRPAGRVWGVWLGQAAVLLALVSLERPWAVAAAAVLCLPPGWWIASGRTGVSGMAARLARSGPWWWAAMVVAAFAAR